jgi:aminoglycoside phosphotransferase family enzyme/predicted kinase
LSESASALRRRATRLSQDAGQADVIAFLRRPESYGTPIPQSVEQVSTHISHVFLAGSRAFKLKRAVKFAYVDFSSLKRRKAMCEREVLLNRRTAPDLYTGVVPVTSTAKGDLRLGGKGKAVEWLVEMQAFDRSRTLDRLACQGSLPSGIARDLADAVAAFHDTAESSQSFGGATAMAGIIAGNACAFSACPTHSFSPPTIAALTRDSNTALAAVAALLDRRRRNGGVRRCHGDLHLGNICLIDCRPTPFDCLEFDDALSTIDVLYDLAFLLMDLVHAGLTADANLVFNRYLDRRNETEGLAAQPLFMSIRAAIRAHVTALKGDDRIAEAQCYVELACDLLKSKPPRLIAIGGLSGSGKSTVAYGLAPDIGAVPGARVIRSDVIRKRMFGVAPETRLAQDAYSTDVTARVYETVMAEASGVLAAGYSTIIDAVSLRPDERANIAVLAANARVPFAGLWLEAPTALLEQRVGGRSNDASDADRAVLHRQTAIDAGDVGWTRIDVSGSRRDALDKARAAIA